MSRVLKHSKNRDALLELLKSVKTHPTADWLYTELKKLNKNLSLATVYRNLNLLCETKDIIKLDVGDGMEHYDATTDEHYHFICNCCASVTDIDIPSAVRLNTETEKLNDVLVQSNSLLFYGLCKNCK